MDIQVTMIQIIVVDPVEGRGWPPPPPPPTSLCQGLDRTLNSTSSTMLSHGRVVQGGLN